MVATVSPWIDQPLNSPATSERATPECSPTLGVAYVLDGSLRKSGSTMRIAARLVRADNGFVVWSETYDRRSDDTLEIQDDIAGEVTKALRQSMDAK